MLQIVNGTTSCACEKLFSKKNN